VESEPLVIRDVDATSGIAIIRLNRPEKKNALSKSLIGELGLALRDVRDCESIRCIVLDSVGDCFCAGRDLYDLRDSYASKGRFGEDRELVVGLVRLLRSAPQITLACVEGYCLGGGLALLQACDLAVVADDAKIGMPEILRGSYGRSATPLLFQARVPIKHAFLMQLTGENVSGLEAVRMGLASRSAPSSELRSKTLELARQIASRDRFALEHAKIAAYTALDLDLDMALKMDEALSDRQRLLTNPVKDVEGFLASRKQAATGFGGGPET
jgi:enoyl-CoA hydratase/carnithine racemase